MNILIVSKFFSPARGGIETVAMEQAKGLARLGHYVSVFCSRASRGEPNFAVFSDCGFSYEVSRFWTMFAAAGASFSPIMLWHLLFDKFDIALLQEPNPMSNLMAYSSCKIRGKPFIIFYQADLVNKGFLGKLYKPLQRRMLRDASVVVPSTNKYISISDTLDPLSMNLRVVPNSIDLCSFGDAHLKRNDETLLFIGRLVPYKGVNILLEALAKVRKRFPNVLLLIAGDGPLREQLIEKSMLLGLNDNVDFLIHVDDASRKLLLGTATALVLPSVTKAEAFGMVILEAQASGCPVITTDISGTSEVAGEAGIVAYAGDSESLADALCAVLMDKQLRENLSSIGLEQVKCYDTGEVCLEIESACIDSLRGVVREG